MKIILGSQSSGRKAVLTRSGVDFETMAANINEKAIRSSDFKLLPLLLARAKADALLPKISEPVLLITSDQVVVWNGELREKPETKQQAREYLRGYEEAPAQTNTAVVVTNTQNGRRFEATDIAKVYFRHIPDQVIGQLIEEGSVLHCAGAFAVEHPLLAPYIERIEGEMESITGLPITKTLQLLQKAQNS